MHSSLHGAELSSVYCEPLIFSITGNSLPASARFVSYEGKLLRESGLTACPACKVQVNSQIKYCVGRHAWLMCFVFILCG